MNKVEEYVQALDMLPKDNGRNLAWGYDLVNSEARDYIRVTMQDRWAKPIKYYQRYIPYEYIDITDDVKGAASNLIILMYEEAGEHNNTEKLLMSPDEAAGVLREFVKDFEECGAWDIEDDVLIAALKVAINCLEVTL